MNPVILTTFTDPMMGLSYECEPIFRKLETHYGSRIRFRYVMAGLVRDVSHFMTLQEQSLPPEEGIPAYCNRLAQIYLAEEPIGAMPMHMEGFHLFDPAHRSSYPLCIAYKAAQLADPSGADRFLYNLRYATIVETRPTTHIEELYAVAEETGIAPESFHRHMTDGSAKMLFESDLKETRALNIHTLPSYLLDYNGKRILISQLIGNESFVSLITELTDGDILPEAPEFTGETLLKLLGKHPLIHELELAAAFDQKDRTKLNILLHQFETAGNITRKEGFIRYQDIIGRRSVL